MKLSRILKLSVNMLVHSRLRSWLTIIGIFIGVAAVVAIISLGQSMQQNVNSRLQGLGQDIITINSGSQRAFGPGEGGGADAAINVKPLSEQDINALKLVPGIAYINAAVSGRIKVTYQGANASLSVQGDDPAVFKEFVTTALESGRYLTQSDSRAVVIGNRVAYNIYKKPLSVGSLLVINDKTFRVAGILSSSSGFGGPDNGIYMTTKDARDVLANTTDLKANEFSSITVKVSDVNFINETTTNIQNALRNSHHVASGKEDFSVTSALALQERFSSALSGIVLFLGAIAAVSLLVGGVGVANTMFTSVLEKTKEIGIMKAIGARNSDILLIFLLNSGLLGLVGGMLGIFFGVLATFSFPYIGISMGPAGLTFQTVVSPELLVFGVLFSIAIGMISGAIPAYNASKLRPVEALRYE
jgi:putative ABC transport system permease protein